MMQVYCDTQDGINRWLQENQNKEIVDIKMSANELGEIIMIIYKGK